MKLNLNKINWRKYSEKLDSLLPTAPPNRDNISTVNEVFEMVNTFSNAILSSIEHSTPVIPNSHTNFIRLPSEIINLIGERNYYRRQWQRYRWTTDLDEYKRYDRLVKTEIWNHRNRQWNDRLRRLDKRSKPFWNITKVLRKRVSNIPSLVDQSRAINTDCDKANAFAENFFQNHHVSDNLGCQTLEQQVDNVLIYNSSLNYITPDSEYISVDTINSLLRGLKPRKSCGLYSIKNEFLKNLSVCGIIYLTCIINSCLKLQYFPTCWRIAKVIPILKPGKSNNETGSYRPGKNV